MASTRILMRSSRYLSTRTAASLRAFTTTRPQLAEPANDFSALNARGNDTASEYRRFQLEKSTNPHMTNTNSTIANAMPSVGKDSAPPELLTSVDPAFTPKDSVPENTKRMTGGTQKPAPKSGPNAGLKVGASESERKDPDLAVGEIEGGSFRVEPLRRTGEDPNTIRARLLYQSRKRGTLESDLLLSTFADANLGLMTPAQLQQYDLFLDENDWDIYYWVTQEPTPTSMAYAEGAGPQHATADVQGKEMASKVERAPDGGPVSQTDGWRVGKPRSGEWAQTVGTFKPAYRPVPARWKNSEILAMLRQHVVDRSAGGVHPSGKGAGISKGGAEVPPEAKGKGMAFMPELKNFDA